MEEKRYSSEHGAKWKYSKAVAAMKLSALDEKKLWDLLTKYGESGWIAREVYDQQKSAHQAGDFAQMHAIAQSEVEAEIDTAFDESRSKHIRLMLSASPGFTMERNYEQAFARVGESITPEQALPLALVFTEFYPSLTSREMIPMLKQMNPITGLMPIDEIAFKRLAEVLSARQLDVFKSEKVRRNLTILNRNLYH